MGQKYLGMVSLEPKSELSQFSEGTLQCSFNHSCNFIQVSMIGVNFEDNHVATGVGNHLAHPILRDEWHENLSFEDGVKLLEKCMRVLLYRDRSAINKLQVVFFPV